MGFVVVLEKIRDNGVKHVFSEATLLLSLVPTIIALRVSLKVIAWPLYKCGTMPVVAS